MKKDLKNSKGLIISIFLILFVIIIAVDVIFLRDDTFEGHYFKMDTNIVIKGKGSDMDRATRDILKDMDMANEYMNASDIKSRLYALNNSGGKEIAFNEDTSKAIAVAEDVKEKSGGAYNIAIKPLIDAWGFSGKHYKVPTEKEIADAQALVNSTKIVTNGNKISISGGGAIDLSSIAKGYVSDLSISHLKKYKVEYAVLDFGGNIVTYGKKPDGEKFVVAIDDGNEGVFATLNVGPACIITSGNYQRYFERNGNRYHHIIDPATGYPVDNGLVSVTIISDSGALADALSTACFVLGKENGMKLAKSYGVSAVFLDENKNIYTVGNVDITLQKEGYVLK